MNKFKLIGITVGLLWCTNGCAITTQYISQASVGTTGYTIAQPGHYVVTENITFEPLATATAIMITTSGVTLDLNNYFIQHVAGLPAAVNGLTVTNSLMDIVIKNGTFSRFSADCVRLLNGSNAITLSNLKCLNSTAGYGLLVDPSTSDIVITDCLFKGNFLGGGSFSNVDKVTMYNSKFNDNSVTGLVATGCGVWYLENCQFNKNLGNDSIQITTGLNALNCRAFSIEHCQFNGNISRGKTPAPPASPNMIYGLLTEECPGWSIKNSSFNNNEKDLSLNSDSEVRGLVIVPGDSVGFVVENCECLANIATSTNPGFQDVVAGIEITEGTAGFLGIVIRGCKFIGNRVMNAVANSTSLAFGFRQLGDNTGIEVVDCIADSNFTAHTSLGTGFLGEGFGLYFSDCRAINNGCTDAGTGIGFDIGRLNAGTTNSIHCAIRNNKAYRQLGTTTFGFRDQAAVVQNWYAGNESFANTTNYSTIITGGTLPPIVLSRDSNPTYTVFDSRGIDNISIP